MSFSLKSDSNPLKSGEQSELVDANKSSSKVESTKSSMMTTPCYQPDKCFQFRKPTTSYANISSSFNQNQRHSSGRFSTSYAERLSKRKTHFTRPYHSNPFPTSTKTPSNRVLPTPKLIPYDPVGSYYGISEDPYCKHDN